MSLWYESLSECLYDCQEHDKEPRARCILSHLSMRVPRLCWEAALESGDIPTGYIKLLRDLCDEVNQLPNLTERFDYGQLAALAFADEDLDNARSRFGDVSRRYSIEEYLQKAKEALAQHPELRQLVEKISNCEP